MANNTANNADKATKQALLCTLTEQERLVLWGKCHGKTDTEISKDVFLAESSLPRELTHIYEKLGVSGARVVKGRKLVARYCHLLPESKDDFLAMYPEKDTEVPAMPTTPANPANPANPTTADPSPSAGVGTRSGIHVPGWVLLSAVLLAVVILGYAAYSLRLWFLTVGAPPQNGIELLARPWQLAGDNGADEAYQTIPSNALQGKDTIRVTYDLHGLNALGGDASALIFDQNGWQYVSLSGYGQNGRNGFQAVDIPLSAFASLHPDQPVGTLHTRFWYSSSFVVDITSVYAYNSHGNSVP